MRDLKSKAGTKPQYFGLKVGRAVVSFYHHKTLRTQRLLFFNTFNSALWLTCTEIILLKKIKHFHFCNTKLNMYNKIKWYDTNQTYLRYKYIGFKLTVIVMHYYLAETQLKHLRYERWLSELMGHQHEQWPTSDLSVSVTNEGQLLQGPGWMFFFLNTDETVEKKSLRKDIFLPSNSHTFSLPSSSQ